MPTILLTLGRLPKALALARACRAVGCRVIVADPFRWHLCRPSRAVDRSYRVRAPNEDLGGYFQDLLDIIAREEVSLVLPVSEEALHVASLAPRLPAGVTLFGAGRERLEQLHDKLRFTEFAQSLALPVPETHAAGTAGAASLCARSDFIEKPMHSCSGIGLRMGSAGEQPLAGGGDVLLQEFLRGELLSTLSVLRGGRELATVVYRGTVMAGTVAVCFERVDEAPAVRDWIRGFISGSDYEGFLAFDFIVGDDGVARALECNPRTTSGVHFLDPASLGQALLDPGATAVALSDRRRYQWAYSTLTEAYAALLRPREFRRRFREMLTARDVIWAADDPLPFLLMTPMSWEILWPAMTTSLTLGEATQRDIAWFGEARP
jgi:predicted ATP-grasp superfamily ATP-dependent carboligase